MLLVLEARQKAGLAESIALEKFHVRQKLPRPMDELRCHWRTAISQNLEAAQVERLCFGHLRQQVQHRWHEHCMGHVFALYQLTETLRTKLWNRHLAGAERWCCEHSRKISNMKNRRRVEIDAAFSVPHPIAEMVQVRQDVCVRHHDALRPAREATCVDESENRFRFINRFRTGLVIKVKGCFIE